MNRKGLDRYAYANSTESSGASGVDGKGNSNNVGVLSAGSAIEMPWHACCRALLHGYLGGQASASAMLDVLIGKVNRSGRLSETYPIRYEDTPAFQYFPVQSEIQNIGKDCLRVSLL